LDIASGKRSGMKKHTVYVGADIGGTNIKVLALTGTGKRLAMEESPTSDLPGSDWRQHAREAVVRVLQRFSGPVRIGVAAPGLPAHDARSIAHMPGRLPGLEGLVWQKWLKQSKHVPVLNDARAALLGEVWLGAARGGKNVVLLTLGTGVGGAAMVDGHILHGHIGRAGHLGHVPVDFEGVADIANCPGSLEDAIGEATVKRRSRGTYATTRELVEAARKGDQVANKLWSCSVKALAAAIAGFINVLDPETIVLGGGITKAGPFLFKPLRAELDRFEWRPGGKRVRIVKAALGSEAGGVGAARAAMDSADK